MPPTEQHVPVPRRRGSGRLRAVVLGGDAIALLLGWAVTLGMARIAGMTPQVADAWAGTGAVLGVGLLALHATGAHERRIARVRRKELTATTRAALVPAALLVVLLPTSSLLPTLAVIVASAVVWALLLATVRAGIGEWIRGRRARGHLRAPVLVVGTGRAREVADFLDAHPHLGFAVADTVELLPESEDEALRLLVELATSTSATGVVVSDPGDPVVRPLLPALTRLGLHVHISTGVQGLALETSVTSSLGGELFLDFAPREVPEWEQAAIRALDVTIASLGVLLTLPVTLVAAAAIRLTDGGAVFYVQERVGRLGQHFPMLKFRSMREGADGIDVTTDDNGREGPLTKIARDPRVTAVGRLLRASSVDELPQLLNVLRGDMSIVGPRPALPSEHAQFDDELRRRTNVRPGLTGLWQVEGRDLPSFELYRRLDLLYVDNLSVRLYLSTLLRTLTALAGHTVRAVAGGGDTTLTPDTPHDAVVLDQPAAADSGTQPSR